MPQYTVALPEERGGGFVTVNASDPGAARENAGVGGNATVLAGGHAAHQETGYAVGGYGPEGPPAPSGGGGGGGGGGAPDGSWIERWLQMIASGNDRAFFESVREYNLEHGLDVDKFNEVIRQYNENLAISQAGLTGAYQGQPTFPALTSYANQFGMWGVPQQGQQTLAAQQQAYAQQLGAIQAAAGLQANPFRQAQVIGQLGGLLSGRGVAGFQAPGQAQGQTDFSGMGNLQRLIDDIRGGPGAINSQSVQSVLDAIPTPAKLDSPEFLRASPLTQSLVLQGMQEKYGLNPQDALAQIRNTLPQFAAPTTFGGVRR
jgi:hypothetical protein